MEGSCFFVTLRSLLLMSFAQVIFRKQQRISLLLTINSLLAYILYVGIQSQCVVAVCSELFVASKENFNLQQAPRKKRKPKRGESRLLNK